MNLRAKVLPARFIYCSQICNEPLGIARLGRGTKLMASSSLATFFLRRPHNIARRWEIMVAVDMKGDSKCASRNDRNELKLI